MDTQYSAQVLTEALPYIQKHWNKVVVIKYGGNAMINEELRDSVMRDIVLLTIVGIRVVVIHGGGPEISGTLKKLGKESRFIDGLRYTDQETAEVVEMVLAGKVNKNLVSLINQNNGRAIGLCGVDGRLFEAIPKESDIDLGFVGKIKKVDIDPINMILDNGYIPIISTVGTDESGQIYNINADMAAASIAGALSAEKLIFMTDIRGLLQDLQDEDTLMRQVNVNEIEGLMERGVISGGMIPKIQSCVLGIESGVREAVIIDGRIEHAILLELFSDNGIGTLLYGGKNRKSIPVNG